MPDIREFSSHYPAAKRKLLFRLRTGLLASAAASGIVALVVLNPGEFGHILLDASAPVTARAAEARQEPVGFADLVAKVKPAVISVRVRITKSGKIFDQVLPGPNGWKFFYYGPNAGQQKQIVTGEGSGFFISADGYAVTNNHVVDHAKSVQVTTNDGTIYTAKVIGTDPKSDLALLKVDSDKQFPYVQFAEHNARVGSWVVAVGNPFGLGGTVTAGIVSARGRDIGSNPYDNYLQIDAPINKGNSGGPAFNMNGHVIGVNTMIFSPSGGSVGIGFDIPANTVKMVVDQLKAKGYVTRGWMGVQIQPVTAGIADGLGLKNAEGALVDQPQPNSPAANAGIKVGDVITAVNGAPVKDARTLAQKIATQAPGSSVQLTVWRDGQTKTIDLTVAEMPRQQQAQAQGQQHPASEPHLGLSLAPAEDVAGSGDKGVVVTGMDSDGPAAQNGMQIGDVILDAGGKTVETPSDVRHAINQTRSEGKHAILLRVKTAQGGTSFLAVPIG
jgi:serine protease Do